ncbi:MAG: hypothetical protein U1E17_02090 [Geminicoccaceae bacterium]
MCRWPRSLGVLLGLAVCSTAWAAPWAIGDITDGPSRAVAALLPAAARAGDPLPPPWAEQRPLGLGALGLLGPSAGGAAHLNAATTYSYLADAGPAVPALAQLVPPAVGAAVGAAVSATVGATVSATVRTVAESEPAPTADVSYTLADAGRCTDAPLCALPGKALLLASAGGLAGLLGWFHFRRHQPDPAPPA